jgi:hypothetical protein
VLTDVINNGTQRTRGFILVQASRCTIALRPVCVGCIMILGSRPPLPLLLYAKGGRVYLEDPVSYGNT